MFSSNIFFIAEAGINHNGSLKLARKLVEKAKLAGCNAIKFQSFITEKLMIKKNKKKFDLLKKYELSFEKQSNIINFCKTKKIIFISSPFDIESFNFLKKKKS